MVRPKARGTGVLAVVEIGRYILGGVEEKGGSGSRGFGRRGVNRKVGGNAPIITTVRD